MIIRISSPASIIRSFKASRTNRIRFSEDSFRPVLLIQRSMRRALQPIHYRRPESAKRNSFRNDKIEIGSIQLAQITK